MVCSSFIELNILQKRIRKSKPFQFDIRSSMKSQNGIYFHSLGKLAFSKGQLSIFPIHQIHRSVFHHACQIQANMYSCMLVSWPWAPTTTRKLKRRSWQIYSFIESALIKQVSFILKELMVYILQRHLLILMMASELISEMKRILDLPNRYNCLESICSV